MDTCFHTKKVDEAKYFLTRHKSYGRTTKFRAPLTFNIFAKFGKNYAIITKNSYSLSMLHNIEQLFNRTLATFNLDF